MPGLEPGATVVDRYTLLSKLGAGGMAVVYLARDERLGREVALKAVNLDQCTSAAELRARLLREARTTAKLDHPGIVQVFDVGETAEGETFVVMELVRGSTVRALLDAWLDGGDTARIAPAEAVRIVAEVADCLASAHAKGLVHRDVKPENVMVRDDGRIALLDFGIAKALRPAGDELARTVSTQLTPAGVILGTIAYISPEQARALDIGPASDQFSLGVMAHELLACAPPWTATHPMKILAKILALEPAPVANLATRLPLPLAEVISQALRREPSERFPNIAAFASAFAEAFARCDPATLPMLGSHPPPHASTTAATVSLQKTRREKG